MEKSPPKLRRELKQIINRGDDIALSSRLRHIFRHDGYAGRDGTYRITSLYFDSPQDKALRQKVDGVDRREKFRLRYYNDDLEFIRLEKKLKTGGLCAKYSAVLNRAQAEAIVSGDYDFLAASENALMVEFYSKLKGELLRPKTVVVYDREAFVYAPANVRITLDRTIRSARTEEFWQDDPCCLQAEEKHLTILEIKYDEFLPDIVRLAVQTPGRMTGAYSKYAVCRRFD